jgi:hypothetical protein
LLDSLLNDETSNVDFFIRKYRFGLENIPWKVGDCKGKITRNTASLTVNGLGHCNSATKFQMILGRIVFRQNDVKSFCRKIILPMLQFALTLAGPGIAVRIPRALPPFRFWQ